jgi:transcriptional regulator with XRE-family HTH domain
MLLPQHSLSGLKPLRLARNMTREHLAAIIGVTATSYDRFENGIRRLYFDKACALADALGCSLDALRGDPGAAQAGSVVNLGNEPDGSQPSPIAPVAVPGLEGWDV